MLGIKTITSPHGRARVGTRRIGMMPMLLCMPLMPSSGRTLRHACTWLHMAEWNPQTKQASYGTGPGTGHPAMGQGSGTRQAGHVTMLRKSVSRVLRAQSAVTQCSALLHSCVATEFLFQRLRYTCVTDYHPHATRGRLTQRALEASQSKQRRMHCQALSTHAAAELIKQVAMR